MVKAGKIYAMSGRNAGKSQIQQAVHAWNSPDGQRVRYAVAKRERRRDRNARNEHAQGRGPEGLTLVRGGWVAECCVCGKDYPVDAPAHDFHPDMSYCGGSERCCP